MKHGWEIDEINGYRSGKNLELMVVLMGKSTITDGYNGKSHLWTVDFPAIQICFTHELSQELLYVPQAKFRRISNSIPNRHIATFKKMPKTVSSMLYYSCYSYPWFIYSGVCTALFLIIQWIGLRENLHENSIFDGKNQCFDGFL